MARLVTLLALALFLAEAVGASTLVSAEPECEASCPDDGSEGECPPWCQLCACCTRARTLPPAVGVPLPVPSLGQGLRVRADGGPPSPDPDEILHVPKSVRA